MAAKVKCLYCQEEFSRERTEFMKVGRRYAHTKCYEEHYEKEKAEADEYRKVTDLIQKLYYPQKPDWGTIGSQIKRYKDEGMTYMGMYYTLQYHCIVKGNDIKEKGIGIIPYIYQKAKAYYKNVNNTYTKTAEIEQKKDLGVTQTENIVTIVHNKPKKRLIDFNYE